MLNLFKKLKANLLENNQKKKKLNYLKQTIFPPFPHAPKNENLKSYPLHFFTILIMKTK